jgi:hypothetical protein
MGLSEPETWALVEKVGWDSVPAVRTVVVATLAKETKPLTNATIMEKTGLPETTTRRVVEDLVALRLARREKVAGKWHTEQSETASDYWQVGRRGPGEGGATPRADERESIAVPVPTKASEPASEAEPDPSARDVGGYPPRPPSAATRAPAPASEAPDWRCPECGKPPERVVAGVAYCPAGHQQVVGEESTGSLLEEFRKEPR